MDPIEVEGPDGVVIEFPAGTDRATIQQVMRRRYSAQQASAPQESPEYWNQQFEQATGPTAAPRDMRADQERAQGFVQSRRSGAGVNSPASFLATGMAEGLSLSDETAAFGARVSNLYDRIGGNDRPPLNPALVAQAERDRLQQARDERPIQQGAREFAASLPLAAVGGNSLRATTAAGAGFGSVAGFGAGETPEERTTGALVGAGVGAAVGSGVKVAGDAVGRALSPLARAVQRRFSGEGANMTRAQRRAFAELRQAFQEEGMSGREVMDTLRRYQDSGFDDATLMDAASPNGPVQRLVRAAGTRGGEAGRNLESLLQERLTTQADRVGSQLSRNLSRVDNFTQESGRLVRARAERAAPLYYRAFYQDGPVGGGVGLDDMMRLQRDADMAAPSVEDALAGARQLRQGGPRQGETLSQFVRRLGGVSDDRGDVAALAGSRHRAASLVRQSGRQIDDLAQAARDSGYFRDIPNRSQFLDALGRDLSGSSVRAMDDVSQIDRAGLDQMREWFERNGVDWTETNEARLRDQVARAFAPEGQGGSSADDLSAIARQRAVAGAEESARLVTIPRQSVEVPLSRIPDSARIVARRLARIEGRGLGSLDSQGVAVQDLHYLKLALDDVIGASRRGQNAIGSTERRSLVRVREELMAAMPESWRQANDVFAGESALIDALQAGRDALKGDAEAIEMLAGSMTESERQMFRAGLVRAARAEVERTQDGGDVVRRVIGNEDRRRRLAAAFDDPADFERFVQALQAEQMRVRNARFTAPSSGSQTQMRGIDVEREATGTLGDLIRGDFLGAVSRLGYVGRDAARQAQRSATDQELVRIATAVQRAASPEAQQLLLDQVAQEYGEEVAQQVTQIITRGAAPAAVVAANGG